MCPLHDFVTVARYFGAAKDLPGVRELLQQSAPQQPRRKRGELLKYVNADYYGYRDEDDGVIVPLEQAAERDSIEEVPGAVSALFYWVVPRLKW